MDAARIAPKTGTPTTTESLPNNPAQYSPRTWEPAPNLHLQEDDPSATDKTLKLGTKLCSEVWDKLTGNATVRKTIRGYKIVFIKEPKQSIIPKEFHFNHEETSAMRDILLELEEKGVISKCYREKGDFVNTIFLREKRDSVITNKRYRLILNVKCLNEYVLSNHFKMETLDTCLQMMKPNCFMASLDLKDAYFSIPVHNTSTKYLKFQFQGQTYKFLALPQGFKDSPRVFTKIMKPVLAHLRLQGVNASIYIDDIFIQNNSFTTCSKQVDYTMKLIKSLGFTLSEKSSPIPNQTLRHLGFVLNSQSMTVSLAEDKKDKLQSLLTHMSHTTFCSIRDLAQLIGSLVATFPAVPYGPVFYRHMEMSKTQSLKLNAFNFDRRIIISSPCKAEINWWLNEGIHSSKSLTLENPSVFLTTDASTAGWGAHSSTSEFTQGFWSPEEQLLHINVLELKAVLMGLVTLCHQFQNSHILIHIDNTTAVSYINHMGGTHSINCKCVIQSQKPLSYGLKNATFGSQPHTLWGKTTTGPTGCLVKLMITWSGQLLRPRLIYSVPRKKLAYHQLTFLHHV